MFLIIIPPFFISVEFIVPSVKILFFGSANGGKTKLVERLKHPEAEFNPKYRETIGADFLLKTNPNDKSQDPLKLYMWDTAGQERFRSLSTILYRDLKVGIFCIDLSVPLNTVAFEDHIRNFKQETSDQTPLLLVGTKSDLERAVSDEEFNQLLEDPCIIEGFKVSAKTADGVSDFLERVFFYANTTTSDLTKTANESMSTIDKALHLIPPSSELHAKISELKTHIATLSSKTQDLIGKETFDLINKLKSKESAPYKSQAIQEFETQCISHLGGSYPRIKAAIIGVAIAVVVTLVAALVGFGIGFLAGAWTGPGAFISGFLAGSVAAISVVTASSVTGAGLGIFAGVKTHHHLMTQNELIHDIADCARVTDLNYTS